MKNFIFLLIFLTISFTCVSQTTKTFVKSFQIVPNSITVDYDCEKHYNTWDGNMVRIELTITASVPNETMSSFVKFGRYDLEYTNENNTLIVSLPKMKNQIILRGEVIKEVIKMTIWLPETTNVASKTILQ